MYLPTTTPALILLVTSFTPVTFSHPLNLLHSHSHHPHHHKHRHLNINHLFSSLPSSKAAPLAAQHPLQQPLTNIPSPPSAIDISNIHVNMSVTSAETSAPVYILVPLLPYAEGEGGGGGITPAPLHHVRTAKMAGVRYKDAGTMKGFKSPERISCYAHAFSKESAEPQESEEGKSSAFGQGDGEINFAERGGRWYVPEGEIGGFSCLLLSS